MVKKALIFIVLVTINFTYAQNTLGTTQISEDVYEGFTLYTTFTDTYLINNCGEVINQWSSNFPPGNSVYLLENGNLLRAGRTASTDITFGGQGGVVEIYDWDGNLTWQFFYDTPMMRQHHDIFPMPNGNVLILAATRMTNLEAVQAGRDPNLLSETDLYNEQVIEVTPIGTDNAEIFWEWNVKDHLIQDFDSSKDNFGDVSLNPKKLNVNFLNGRSGGSNWLHFNSIQFNSVLNQIVLSSRNLSEIYIIDHSTTTTESATSAGGDYGKGGDFLYRGGNPQAYNQGVETDRKLYGQHYPYIIQTGLVDEGKIMLFNNGNGRTPLFSEVYILNPDTDSAGVYSYTTATAYGPSTPDFIYQDPIAPTDFYSGILSSAQRLPNGNTLICEGITGRFFEITPSEELVWEYVNPVNSNNGTIAAQGDIPSSIQNSTFRGIKYGLDYAAFTGRDLTAGNPIELNPDLTPCNNLSVTNFQQSVVTLYPNPTQSEIQIKSGSIIDKVEIYSVLGHKVGESKTSTINLSKKTNGIYFLRIYSGAKVISKKVIKN
jgi:hypothetical protein